MAVYNIEKYRKSMQKLIGVNRVLTGKPYDTNLAVKCHNGTFVGTEKDGVRSYKGIPYAVPPVGTRRWKAPEPAVPDDGVYEARFFREILHPDRRGFGKSFFVQAGGGLPDPEYLDLSRGKEVNPG